MQVNEPSFFNLASKLFPKAFLETRAKYHIQIKMKTMS